MLFAIFILSTLIFLIRADSKSINFDVEPGIEDHI